MTARDGAGFNRLVVALLSVAAVVLVAGAAIGFVTGSVGIGDTTPAADGGENTSQLNPAELEGSAGDLSPVERQLAQRATERFRNSGSNFSDGRFGDVRDSLENDSESAALLDRYADVAEETGNENKSRLFRNVHNTQRTYATAADRYWSRYEVFNGTANLTTSDTQRLLLEIGVVSGPELNETVATADRIDGSGPNGTVLVGDVFDWNQSQSQRFAKALDSDRQRVERVGDDLVQSYQRLEDESGGNHSESIRSIRASQSRITDTQEAVRERWLSVVTLNAETDNPRGSFADPITIEGRLDVTNGPTIANESVRFLVGNQTYRTRTNSTGAFQIEYRPTLVAKNATSVPIRFTSNTSYTDAEENISVRIEQVRPDISVGTEQSTAGFNDSVSVSGQVHVNDVGVGKVPFLLTVDGEPLSRNVTRTDGTFSVEAAMPASVEDGTRDVNAVLILEDQALAPAEGNTTIDVTEMSSELSIEVEQLEGRTILVSGRLSVPNKGGVPNQPVQIQANETVLGTVTTGDGGRFEGSLLVPESMVESGVVADETRLNIQASFTGESSNVEAVDAGTTFALGGSGIPLWLVGGVLFAIIAGAGFLLYRWSDRTPSVTVGRDYAFDRDNTVDEADATARSESLLEQARTQLEAGQTDAAAQLAYAAVRHRLEARTGIPSSATHWEFYRAYREQMGDGETLDVLGETTRLYERAVFASGSVTDETVSELLASTRSLTDSDLFS